MGLLSKILEVSPYLEVIVRRMYWSTPWLIRLVGMKKINKIRANSAANRQSLEKIERFLRNHGVGTGSILVVHSSADALKPTGYSSAQIVERLIDVVGASGTLAMPAFPRYKEEPQGAARIQSDVSDLELTYDVKKSIPWTGVLPLKLMQRPDAIRSRHPLNTMVAVGALAREMMKNNLDGDKSLPCGIRSSWKFCADNNAIVVALGVDMAHSLTMIHVAEDSFENEWPVMDWYRERKFKVVDGESSANVVVRERHPKWAMHYAERTLSRDLKRLGLLVSTTIDGIPIELIDAGELLEFLNQRKSAAYPYFMIPYASKKKR